MEELEEQKRLEAGLRDHLDDSPEPDLDFEVGEEFVEEC